MKQKFRIAAFSGLTEEGGPAVDPLTIIMASIPVLKSIFPNWFGSLGRVRTTMADMDTLFPSNGYWTSQLKRFLLSHIPWQDWIPDNLHLKTVAFVWEVYSPAMCSDLDRNQEGRGCWSPFVDTFICDQCFARFGKTLEEESTGVTIPSIAGFDMKTLLYAGLITGGIYMFVKMKKGRGKKR